MKFNLVSHDDQRNITVFVDGEMYVADGSHPSFERIVEAVLAGDETVVDLFDVARTASKHFERLSERVLVKDGQIYFDGTVVDNSLTKQVVRFIDEGVDDFKPLVAFFEKVQQNPQDHSREQLFRWLDRHDFTIDEDGDFYAYKGVRSDLTSIMTGPGIVNGEAVEGHVPNPIGGVIEIDRSKVVHNPAVGCAFGLHAGTWSYAKDFAQGAVLKVKVNPRDVVSVPTDCSDQKLRTARYVVVEKVDKPVTSALAGHTPRPTVEWAYDDSSWDDISWDDDPYGF